MADGAIESQWQQTASIMALIANVHRDPKRGRAYKPQDFMPVRGKRKQNVVGRVGVSALKGWFTRNANDG